MLRHIKPIVLLVSTMVLLAGCNYQNEQDRTGFFYNVFAKPLDMLLRWLGELFNHNYGLAIIVIVLIVRLVLLPLMLPQSRAGHMARKKRPVIDPYMKDIKEKARHTTSQEEKRKLNREIFEKYNEYGLNPYKQMLGCLPVLFQIPILFGLLVSIKYPSHEGIYQNRHFLWFDLTQPDILLTLIAGLLYFIQPLVNLGNMENKKFGYILAVIMPTFIILIASQSPSFLGLYWATNATFLIIQMTCTNIIFSRKANREALELKKRLQQDMDSEVTK
ncbi:membrane protein insertase YidC [Staphylococcus canis]|uniref:Membrane protein insertase YidC n=1 Tax=Staphylococcus canis TaxID=2724942 RepID=A0ABS0T5V9_9STAP|nr:membrane protein insertase YidC [Staphylococcus canis]MBI5974132.1 membrane protein insertase YidC [Staphylococcus canis]